MAPVQAQSNVAASPVEEISLAELNWRFRPALKAYFLKRAPAGVDAEDLVQDVFVRLAKRGELTSIRQLEGYMFRTAANVLRDHVRYRSARRPEEGQANPNVIRAAPTAEDIAAFAGTGLDPAGEIVTVDDGYMNLLPRTIEGVDFVTYYSRAGKSASSRAAAHGAERWS